MVFACAKNESEYIKEWVDHYLSIGFDKALIADNNEKDDNSLSEALSDYVADGRVQIFDLRGHESVQVQIYSDYCAYGNYKWCGYFDCDEFFEMGVYNNVKDLLSTLDEYDCVSFNWVLYGPNGQIYRTPGGVQERFPVPLCPILYMKENVFMKSIVKGGAGRFRNCWFNGSHIPTTDNPDIKYSIGGYNEPYNNKTIHAHFPPSYKLGYIKHYYTKSYEEWKQKASRGWPDGTNTLDMNRYYLFDESYAVPADAFLNGLFANGYDTGLHWADRLKEYSVIQLTNNGEFVYPFLINAIAIMQYTTDHTFIITDPHIDDAFYTILLEFALRTGNKLCYARNQGEVWTAYVNHHKYGEPTFYIIGYS